MMTSAHLFRVGGHVTIAAAFLILAAQALGPFLSTDAAAKATVAAGLPFSLATLVGK
jgi:hypothetical protein